MTPELDQRNLLNDKVRFILALGNPVAGELFDNLVEFIKDKFPEVTGAYILNFEAAQEAHEVTTLGTVQTRVIGWQGYIFDLIITQESGNTVQVNIICNQKEFLLTDIQYELLG